MAGVALAEAFVRIRPDTTGFRAEAQSQVTAALAGVQGNVKVGVQLAPGALAKLAALKAALGDLADKAQLRLGLDDPDTMKKLNALETRIGELGDNKLKLSFISTNDIYPQLIKLKKQMQRAGLADFLDIDLAPGQIVSQLVLLKKKIQAVGLTDTLGINLNTSGITAQIAALEASLAALPDVSIGVSATGLGDTAGGVAALATGAMAASTAFKDLDAELASVQAATNMWKTSMAQAAATLAGEQAAVGALSADLADLAGAEDVVSERAKAMAEALAATAVVASNSEAEVTAAILLETASGLKWTGSLASMRTAVTAAMAAEQGLALSAADVNDSLSAERVSTTATITDLDALAVAAEAAATAGAGVGEGGGVSTQTSGFKALAAELIAVQAATDLWKTSMAQAAATLAGEQSSVGATVAGLTALAAAATQTAGSGGGGGGGGGIGFLGAASAGEFFGNSLSALTNHFKITANGFSTLFGSVAAWHVLLDLTAEAIISVGLALIAMGTGIAAVAESSMDIGEHLLAVDEAAAALGVVIPPLTGKLDDLAHSMAPQAIELYGAGLNIVASQAGVLLKAAGPVVTLFDDWAAKIVIWIQAQSQAGALLRSGTGYLEQFGQIIGTLGEALGNLLREDPGIAHYLLDIVQGAAELLKVFTELPAPIVALVLALHGIYVWGNVLGSLFVKLGEFAANMGKSLLSLAANPFFWVAAAAAALAYMTYESTQADTATKNFIDTLNNGLANENASTAISQIALDLGKINSQIQATTTSQVLQGWGASWQAVGLDARATGMEMQSAASGFVNDLKSGFTSTSDFRQMIDGIGGAIKDAFVPGGGAILAVKNDIALLNTEMVKLEGQQANLFKETGNLTNQGYTYAQALSLMNLAGVKAGDSFNLMRAKVSDLITGYQDLSIRGGILANSVNAVTFQMLQQNEKVAQLNSGWDTFESTVSGGETELFKFNNTLVNLNGAFAKNSGQVTTLSKHQAGLIQYFTVAATQANTEMDSLTLLANAAGLGAKGTDMLEQANKDMVAAMIPAAKGSAALTAVLYALAQRGGYQGADSLKALAQYADDTKDPIKNLSDITQTFTVKAAGLTQDVKNLSMALGTTLNNAMATAAFAATNGQKTFDQFATAILTTKFNSDADRTSAVNLAVSLQKLTGNTTDTRKEFISFAEDALHLTQTQADTLWQETFPKLQSTINSLHGTKIPISSVLSGSGDITMKEQVLGKNASGYLEFHAAGGLVGGSGGPTADTVPIMASSGEYVINARSAGALGTPFLNAMNGYAAGGLVSTVKDPWGLFGNWQATNAATWGGEIVKAGAQIAVDAYRAAVKAAAAKAGPGGSITPGVVSVAKYVLAHGGNKIAAAGIGGVIAGESGGNPEILEAGGGGGAGLLQWTPESSAAPYQPIITGNAGKDMATQLADMLYYIAGRGGMNSINNSGSAMAAAGVFSRMEGPAVPGSDIDSGVVLQLLADGYAGGGRVSKGGYAKGGMVTSFDKGGLLPPGLSMAWNGTGRAERVSPDGGDTQILGELRAQTAALKLQNTLTQQQTAMVGQAPVRTAKSIVRRAHAPLGGGWSRVGRPTA